MKSVSEAIYLNNAATSWPKPDVVAEAVCGYIKDRGGNVARGSASSRDIAALDVITTARQSVAALFGGHEDANPRYITFTSGVTESLNIVLKGLLRPGMKAVTTSMEHNAVIRPLRSLEAAGVEVEVVPCSTGGLLPLGALERALSGAKLLVMSACSNVCGTVQPIEEAAQICARHGVIPVFDVAQTAGVLPINAAQLGAVICFTGHKGLMGPAGTGGIVWHPDIVRACSPFTEGGTGSFSHMETQPDTMPDKFEAGTPNLPGIAGLCAALQWLEATGMDRIREHEAALGALFLDGALKIPALSVLGLKKMEGRLPVFALNVGGTDNGTLAHELSYHYGIETRPGLHCAPLAHRTMGTFPGGALRVSMGYFNTTTHVKACLEAIAEISKSGPAVNS